MNYLLAADIGGTKTDLALYDARNRSKSPLYAEILPSQEFESFSDLLHRFDAGRNLRISRACLAVAGPVIDNRAKLTNLPWHVVGSEIEAEFSINEVKIINDLVAIASSIPHLSTDDLVELAPGNPAPGGALGVIAPGTGLGVSFSVWAGDKYIACPSEGGHASFSPANEMEIDLLRFLLSEGNPISIETVCSGMGLPAIYHFVKARGMKEPGWLAAELSRASDTTPIIVQAALDKKKQCPICRETVRLFVGILAEACSNLAVTVMATGGVYLGGGIPPRIISFLREESFVQRFRAKGKMSGLVSGIPVSVIKNPKAALIGAAACMI